MNISNTIYFVHPRVRDTVPGARSQHAGLSRPASARPVASSLNVTTARRYRLWSCFDVAILVLSRLLVGSWCWSLVPPLRLLSACALSLWLSRCAPRLEALEPRGVVAWTGRGSTVLDIRSLLWAWCDSFLARVPVPAIARGSHSTPQPRPGEGGEHETSNELQMRTVIRQSEEKTPRGRNGSYTGLRGGSRD